jgi:hypothetical protein
MRALLERQDDEIRKKKEKLASAKEEMVKWDVQRKKEIETRRKQNKEEEWLDSEKKEKLKSNPNAWEKVLHHVEVKENLYTGQANVNRMRSAMISRKHDIAKKNSEASLI